MRNDAFSACHPLVNFLFFLGAIGFAVVIQHPAYMLAACLCSGAYYLCLHGRKGLKTMAAMVPAAVFMALINPLFNHHGSHVLFHIFSIPYTLEALCYGAVLGGMFVAMMLWFGCYNAVLTSDKFVSLFGNLIPSLSMLLVMVLRMIPNFMRKTKQIIGCRKSIGKGAAEGDTAKEKVKDGMTVMSALTDWALEGSVVTADSMRARGYGTAKRTNYQIYRMTLRDWVLMAVMILLAIAVIAAGGTGATFTPEFYLPPLGPGFAAYCLFLLIPTAMQLQKAAVWHFKISRI